MNERLELEKRCLFVGRELKKQMPEHVGFVLLLADYGEKGSLSYASTIEREGAIELIREFLKRIEHEPARAQPKDEEITDGELDRVRELGTELEKRLVQTVLDFARDHRQEGPRDIETVVPMALGFTAAAFTMGMMGLDPEAFACFALDLAKEPGVLEHARVLREQKAAFEKARAVDSN